MKKSVLLLFHLLFWIFTCIVTYVVFGLLNIFALIFNSGNPIDFTEYLTTLLFVLPIGFAIFYTSYFSLHFFIKKPVRFFLIGGIYIIPIGILIFLDDNFNIFGLLMLLTPIIYFNLFGFLFKTLIEWIKDRKIKAELEKDKISSQLELLKAKLNPHFLFNTLNNIDILIKEQPEKASDYLRKLSEMLRFMLYETDIAEIPLSSEIEHINKYIELQKIRTSNNDFVEFEINGKTEEITIAPMIFMHFIENAFKFASNKKIQNAISIKIDATEKSLFFYCKNHIYQDTNKTNEQNGLGMQLIKKRLDLIYKENHKLSLSKEDNWYIVQLEIKLNND